MVEWLEQSLDPQTQVLFAGLLAVIIGYFFDSNEWFLAGFAIFLLGGAWLVFRPAV